MANIDTTEEGYKRFSQADFEYEKPKKSEPIYFVYPQYVEELRKYKIPLSPDMADKELTSFLTRVADPKSFEKSIPTIVRLKHINRKGENSGKKVEYMIWYENWQGTDKNGHVISPVADLPKGIDKGVDVSRRTDNEGVDHYTVERDYWIYTVPFSPEKLDEILEDTGTDADDVQYICMGIRSFSGYSYDEFRNLSWSELEERGRTGKVQQPVELQNQTGNKVKAVKVKE